MTLQLRPPPANARPRWVQLLLKELAHCKDDIGISLEVNGVDHGLTLRTMHANKGTWLWSNDPNYAYRTILPNEIVFDIGDDVLEIVDGKIERRAQTWEEIVADAEALWDELDKSVRGGAYYAALSGGKGIHTHVFLEDPTDGVMWDGKDYRAHDLREKVADWIRARRLAAGSSRIQWDPVCIAPNHGSRQLREFGAVKKWTKTLYFVGPIQRKSLPRTPAEAYTATGIQYPQTISRCRSIDGVIQAQLRKATGGLCPQSAECLREWCGDCPY